MREVIANLLSLQQLEMDAKRLATAQKEAVAQLRHKIPESILGHYERMRERGKKAVAVVRNSVCTECHLRLPIGIVTELMRGKDIQLCGNCGRYLFLAEEVPTTTAGEPVETKAPRKRPRRTAIVVHRR